MASAREDTCAFQEIDKEDVDDTSKMELETAEEDEDVDVPGVPDFSYEGSDPEDYDDSATPEPHTGPEFETTDVDDSSDFGELGDTSFADSGTESAAEEDEEDGEEDVKTAIPEDRLVPELTEEEKQAVKKEVEETAAASEMPKFYEHPLADRVEELGLMAGVEEDPEFYADLVQKKTSFYQDMKNVPDAVAKKYYPDMCRRFIECERRIKKLEDMLWALPREERSVEEDRFEILTELLDKAANGLEIWDEHRDRELRWGHRLVLEGRLVGLIEAKFDIIETTCNEFHKLGGDRDAANNERDWLRYEIRHCDLNFYDINEAFLKSYLDMDW